MTEQQLEKIIDQWLCEWGYEEVVKNPSLPLCDYLAGKIATEYRDSVIDSIVEFIDNKVELENRLPVISKKMLLSMKSGR